MKNWFNCKYKVIDGYVASDKKNEFHADSGCIEDDMDETDLGVLFDELMEEHFVTNVFPSEDNKEEFIKWAKEVISNRGESE